MTERWLPVVGYEGYEVSDQGRVRGVDRMVQAGVHGGMRLQMGQVLKPFLNTGGYWSVSPRKGGRNHRADVHRLVALAFLGPTPPGLETCHNNGDQLDNRAENLRYDTHSNNQRDQIRHGTHATACKTHCKHGHEFSSENTRLERNGDRRCRACETARTETRRLKRQQERARHETPASAA